MKKFTKFMSLLAASAMLILLPDSNTLTAAADEPTTYTISYFEDEWGYVRGPLTDDPAYGTEFGNLYNEIRDGAIIVVNGNSDDPITLDFPVSLSNVTILNCDSYVIVSAKSIDELHAAAGAVAAVNGNIKDAYIYADASVTLNNNVNNITIYSETDDDDKPNVFCHGTVDHAISRDSAVIFEVYNVAAGQFDVQEALLKTPEGYYSTTAPAAAPAAKPGNNSSNDYDAVPKTGDSYMIYLLLAAAALCFAGSRAVKKF